MSAVMTVTLFGSRLFSCCRSSATAVQREHPGRNPKLRSDMWGSVMADTIMAIVVCTIRSRIVAIPIFLVFAPDGISRRSTGLGRYRSVRSSSLRVWTRFVIFALLKLAWLYSSTSSRSLRVTLSTPGVLLPDRPSTWSAASLSMSGLHSSLKRSWPLKEIFPSRARLRQRSENEARAPVRDCAAFRAHIALISSPLIQRGRLVKDRGAAGPSASEVHVDSSRVSGNGISDGVSIALSRPSVRRTAGPGPYGPDSAGDGVSQRKTRPFESGRSPPAPRTCKVEAGKPMRPRRMRGIKAKLFNQVDVGGGRDPQPSSPPCATHCKPVHPQIVL